jgi:hypothetical protein
MNKLLYEKPQGMTNAQLEKVGRICWDEIQKREELKKEKVLKEFVGKHYKYKNSYSCPESETDYWWLYVRVKEIKDYHLVCQTFQKDKYGKIMIDLNSEMHSIDNNYILCSKEEFDSSFERIMIEIDNAR